MPSYVLKPLSFVQRKFLSKTRLGCLEIRLETARFSRPILEESLRICLVCEQGTSGDQKIENEYHFIFVCSKYEELRTEWLNKLVLPDNFDNLPDSEQLSTVLNVPENIKPTAQFLIDAYGVRSKILNK